MSERTRAAMQRTALAGFSAGRQPPHNPLLRVLFEIERFTLGPTVGIIEDIIQSKDPNIDPRPVWESMHEGWKQAKTFDNIVENPWLAFALNVGADPITWIPGTWTVKGGRILGQTFKKGFMVTGLQNLKPVAKVLDFGASTRHYLGRKFVRDYDIKRLHGALKAGKIDDPDGSLLRIIEEYHRDYERFMDRFSYGVEAAVQQGVINPKELELITFLMEQPVSPLEIAQAAKTGKMKGIPPRAIQLYNELSDTAKDTYQFLFREKLLREEIMNMRGIIAREIMVDLEKRSGIRHLPHIYGEWYHNMVVQRLHDLIYTTAETGKVPADKLIQIAFDVPDHLKPLAELTVDAKNISQLRKAVNALPDGHPTRDLFRVLEADTALFALKRSMRNYQARSATVPRSTRPLWAHRMAEYIWNNPGKSAARHIRKLFPGRQIRSGEFYFRGRGKKAAPEATQKHPAFPTAEDLQQIYAMEPHTRYTGIKDFFNRSREAVTFRKIHLKDLIEEGTPEELLANYTRPLNLKSISQLDEMADPDKLKAMEMVDDALNKNLFDKSMYDPTKRRSRLAPIEEIARDNYVEIETRIDRIMATAGASLARAMAKQNLGDRLLEFTLRHGLFATAEDMADATKLGTRLRGIKEKYGDEFYNLITPTHPSSSWIPIKHPSFQGLRVPRAIAKEINRAINVGEDPKKIEGFFRVFKKVQDFWKAWTLSIFPQYHTRNFISNLWNNFLAGIGDNPIHFARDMGFYRKAMRLQHKYSMAKRLGKELTDVEKKLLDELKEYRVISGGEFVGEIGDIIRKHDFKLFDLATLNPSRSFWAQSGFAVGRYVEDNARIAHYLWARHAKGLSAAEAAKSVHKYLFDYKRGLTPFETKYMRDFLMPFYAWTRFNLPLQIEMLIKQPSKFLGVAKFKDAWEQQWGGPDPEEEFLADWMKRAMSIRWRYNRDKGTYEYFMLDTWLPASDINKVLSIPQFRDMMTNMLSPGIKMPIEIMWNYNLFRKKPLQEYEKQKVPLQITPDTKIWMTPQIEHFFRHARLINDIDRFLSTTEDVSTPGRVLRFILGKSFPFDPVDQKLWMIKKLTQQKDSLEHRRNRAIAQGDYGHADNLQEAIDLLNETIDDYQRR